MARLTIGEIADRCADYMAQDGPCSCGQAHGHTGWLTCVAPEIRSTAEDEQTFAIGFAIGKALVGQREAGVDMDIDDAPFIGNCSVCGRARNEDYTCRKGGSTVKGGGEKPKRRGGAGVNEGGVGAFPMGGGENGWHVYWYTVSAHGARGHNLTSEEACDLASRLRSGEEKP